MNILISGAGVAGLTLAYWLSRYGFKVTLVEKHAGLRTGGYKIDLRGVALEVVKRMGIYPAIVESQTDIRKAICVDEEGHPFTEMTADLSGTRLEGVDLEIMRGLLCVIIKDAVPEAEYLFGDSVTRLREEAEGVHVEFEKNKPRKFDLVIGADGLHSKVRELIFGDESKFSKEMGVFVSVFTFPNFLNLNDCEVEHHALRKFVNLYKDRKQDSATAAIAFSVEKPFSSRDPKKQQELIQEVFKGSKWEIPKILAAMKDSPDFYFDNIAQIHMPQWSKGRVALVGDAAYSATPLAGQGTSIAIAGAYVLAGELSKGNYQTAFIRYEEQVRPFAEKNQALADMSAQIMSGSIYSRMLHWIGSILPASLILYFKNKGLARTTEAANALRLKDYP